VRKLYSIGPGNRHGDYEIRNNLDMPVGSQGQVKTIDIGTQEDRESTHWV